MRRRILAASGSSFFFCLLAAPQALLAQQPGRVWRVGYLTNRRPRKSDSYLAFVEGMRSLGYVEGRNLVMEVRSADEQMERHPELARELVRLKVDVIVTTSGQSTAAAQRASATVPVVMISVGDPVGAGFVKNLARPGGNITGLSSLTQELALKQLDLLLGVAPSTPRVAVLVDPDNPVHAAILRNVREAAQRPGVSILPVEARSGPEIAAAFAQASREKAAAVLVNGAIFNFHLREIAELAAKHRMVSISAFHNFPGAGGLMSYGQNSIEQYRRAPIYVDKIFKGAKPGDLPVEQPTRFELIVNLKTAKALGLTIPPVVMVQVTKVIE